MSLRKSKPEDLRNSGGLRRLYFLIFLFSVNAALPIYIAATFLGKWMDTRIVGLLYSVAAVFTLITLAFLPRIISRFGNRNTLIGFTALETLVLAGIATIPPLPVLIPLFMLHLVALPAVSLSFDLFIQSRSKEQDTGSIRGMVLTAANVAWVFGPSAAGYLAATRGYGSVFLTAAIFLSMVLLGTVLFFKRHETAEAPYETSPLYALKRILRTSDLRRIILSQFLLQFFFAGMVIYTPLYLREYIGLSWETIGVIFSVMLLPFLLLEYPLGRLADRTLGEKEMLTAGFIIAALAAVALAFIRSANPFVWAAVLFLTRVGASMIEIMNDTFFFKHVSGRDAEIVSIYRMTHPAAYILVPLTMGILLSIMPFRFVFILLGIITLYGVRYSLSIKDTL